MWSCKFGPCFLCSLTSCSNSGGTFQNSPGGTEEILLQIAAPGCTALLPSLESNIRKQCKRGGTLWAVYMGASLWAVYMGNCWTLCHAMG